MACCCRCFMSRTLRVSGPETRSVCHCLFNRRLRVSGTLDPLAPLFLWFQLDVRATWSLPEDPQFNFLVQNPSIASNDTQGANPPSGGFSLHDAAFVLRLGGVGEQALLVLSCVIVIPRFWLADSMVHGNRLLMQVLPVNLTHETITGCWVLSGACRQNEKRCCARCGCCLLVHVLRANGTGERIF